MQCLFTKYAIFPGGLYKGPCFRYDKGIPMRKEGKNMVYQLLFSPTGGTRAVADALATGQVIDLTDCDTDFSAVQLTAEDVAVIAVPSYGGRVPEIAAQRLTRVQGGSARAVLVCVYGNRAYEDTLVELADLAAAAGFRVVAAVAALAEHSIARMYAAGRPDEADKAVLGTLWEKIRAKLDAGDDTVPALPGQRPYKPRGTRTMVPRTSKRCVACGRCTLGCPVGAIDPRDPRRTDPTRCIGCMRCVQICPVEARQPDPDALAALVQHLDPLCADRKENELFL